MKTVDEKVAELMNKNTQSAPGAIKAALRNAFHQGINTARNQLYSAALQTPGSERTSFQDQVISNRAMQEVAAVMFQLNKTEISFDMRDLDHLEFNITRDESKKGILTVSVRQNFNYEELDFSKS